MAVCSRFSSFFHVFITRAHEQLIQSALYVHEIKSSGFGIRRENEDRMKIEPLSFELPFFLPADDGLSVLEFDGEPDVAGVAGTAGAPDVGHEDVAIAVGQDIGGLTLEGDF